MKLRFLGIFVLILVLATHFFAETYPSKPLNFIAPAGPGGGWDTTIRVVAQVLKETNLVTQPIVVNNMPGGGGGVALAHMQTKKGDPYNIIVFSPPLLLINLTGQTQYSYKNLTPLAMLIHDYGAFAVSKKSKYNSIAEVMEALKKDPKSVKVGGISSFGSMDHIQFLIAAKAAGVENLKDITYVSFQEGEHMAALLGGHIDVLSTGLAEVTTALQTGAVKVLAITAPQRVGGILANAPTLREEGIDAEFINWRGLFGAPEMPEYAVKYWVDTLNKMVQTPEWDKMVNKYNWTKAFMPSEEFAQYLAKVNEDYKIVLKEIGLYKGE
ncbi:Bug family tripartite tricarboxylate transporter substrate binding protein [Thermotoga profunda]|uniref:Bug family tripartite tricarboxylate transporter substrate binding protein n=1 Tax=Thermotoga profunda TaxID=1508420 RepID=UPI000596B565|nr:tripartite tricarboxylate transporter substrate-binding protein [Thermotoga profunda]